METQETINYQQKTNHLVFVLDKGVEKDKIGIKLKKYNDTIVFGFCFTNVKIYGNIIEGHNIDDSFISMKQDILKLNFNEYIGTYFENVDRPFDRLFNWALNNSVTKKIISICSADISLFSNMFYVV